MVVFNAIFEKGTFQKINICKNTQKCHFWHFFVYWPKFQWHFPPFLELGNPRALNFIFFIFSRKNAANVCAGNRLWRPWSSDRGCLRCQRVGFCLGAVVGAWWSAAAAAVCCCCCCCCFVHSPGGAGGSTRRTRRRTTTFFSFFSTFHSIHVFSPAKIVSHFSLQKRENWTTFTLSRTFISPHVGLRASALKKKYNFLFFRGRSSCCSAIFFLFLRPTIPSLGKTWDSPSFKEVN